MKIPLISTIFSFYHSIYELIGKKSYLILLASILISFMETIGIALVIPLFLILSKPDHDSWWMDLVKDSFEFFHLEFSITRFFVLVIAVFIMRSVFMVIGYRLDALLFYKAQCIAYKKIVKGLCRMSYPFFLSTQPGYFNNLLQTEADRAITSINYYSKALNNLLMAIILFTASLLNNLFLTSLTILLALLILFLFKGFYAATKKLSSELANINTDFQNSSIQMLNNFKYLIGSNLSQKYGNFILNLAKGVVENRYKTKILTDTLTTIGQISVLIGMAGLIYVSLTILKMDLERTVISLILCQRGMMKVLTFQNSWQTFNNLLGSFKYYYKNIKKIEDNYEERDGQDINLDQLSVELINVKFNFNQNFAININKLIINNNEITSIVGLSGSGKTTVLDLLTRIYTVESGTIKINGVNINEIKIEELRNSIGFVNQENSLFNDTLFRNISSWDEDNQSNRDKVREVAKLANMEDFIEGLSGKYDTQIGDRGVKLSGGQRQRITIARELYKEPKLLLLDEATSALDSESEKRIQNTIDSLRGKITIVIVAHRLSTVKNSDKIVVLDNGSILEEGSFNSLMASSNSKFKELVSHQLIKEQNN